MKHFLTFISFTLLAFITCVASFQVNAAESRPVHVVYTVDVHNNTQAYLGVVKPIIARLKQISPKTVVRVYEAQFAGSGAGEVFVVVEQPSMAYIEGNREKVDNDPEVSKLIPKLGEVSTLKGVNLYMDVAPDQATDIHNPVQVLYAINTNGKTAAYLEATKKIDARFMAVNKKSTVRVFENMYGGANAGGLLIVVGFPSMTDLEQNESRVSNDPELPGLFTDRDKIGAKVVYSSLLNDITPK